MSIHGIVRGDSSQLGVNTAGGDRRVSVARADRLVLVVAAVPLSEDDGHDGNLVAADEVETLQ